MGDSDVPPCATSHASAMPSLSASKPAGRVTGGAARIALYSVVIAPDGSLMTAPVFVFTLVISRASTASRLAHEFPTYASTWLYESIAGCVMTAFAAGTAIGLASCTQLLSVAIGSFCQAFQPRSAPFGTPPGFNCLSKSMKLPDWYELRSTFRSTRNTLLMLLTDDGPATT